MEDVRRASVRQLAYKIKDCGKQPRFAFFLGAGASRDSGVITAPEMIRVFKERIIAECCPDNFKTATDKEAWLAAQGWYDKSNEYCQLFEQFEPKEIGRQRFIESIIEGQEPSFGYVVLANLMASGYINTIITTNFDDLVYGACTSYTAIRPIVYAYGVLASEMRITSQRPRILKLHGDYLYSAIKNTGIETATQDQNMERQSTQILSEYGLVVVGYGGGDQSIMKMLRTMSDKNDLYWCTKRGDVLNDSVKNLLKEKRGFLVEIDGFDRMMNEMRHIVGFDVGKMFGSIQDRQDHMIDKLRNFAPDYSVDILTEMWKALDSQRSVTKEKRDKVYQLDLFLKAVKAQEVGDLKTAESLYQEIIKRDPSDALAQYNLGTVLDEDPSRFHDAEKAYLRAIELNPNSTYAYNNLGTLLARDHKRTADAEASYRKVIEIDPINASAYYNLATLFDDDPSRYVEAKKAYCKAIDLDPLMTEALNNLLVLLRLRKRVAEALATAEELLKINSQDVDALLALAAINKKLRHQTKSKLYASRARELIKPNDWYYLACLESISGNQSVALEDLRRAGKKGLLDIDWAMIDPDLEWARAEPRFASVLKSQSRKRNRRKKGTRKKPRTKKGSRVK